jgi:riboflavin-specific deaminase-like protein
MLVVKVSWPRLERPAGVGLPEQEWLHGLHGGALETAMMLHLRPELVRTEAVADFASLGQELEGELRRLGPEGEASFSWLAGDLNAEGVVGDATLATAEMGALLVDHYGAALADVILDTLDFPLQRLASGGSSILDEEAAWALLRAAGGVRVAGDGPCRGEAASVPGAWLDVRRDGSWAASTRVTERARELLDLFVPVVAPEEIVIGQLGQSLDGRIATEAGASHYVTGSEDIERLHRLRALVDAVVVGASTVEHDDPRLTVRLVEGENPVRVVLDPSRRLGSDRRVVSEAGGVTIMVRGETAGAGAASPGGGSAAAGPAYDELTVPRSDTGDLDLAALLGELRTRGLRRILVEGGGLTVSRFLEQGLLDRLHLTVAPMLIGSGRPSITLPPVASLDHALRPGCRRFTLGEDVLFDLDLETASG